uniref:Uncharacterized protein n=1 Tax=Chromera velia CCMP2878 TaxID=1169474 RepID=A0A0G4HZ28_9ALVE|eukprot:Cvel_33780.t1-p1 / transcript=Cvel_33780.t1 / gene=Cvel_33780 / organism=Chromera_velia_CCMP2878 / gene_product=hypothetical protein / transcript_product=hypothetical protein / location=Cvel_scaffold5592:210-1816(+) / protein_length=346 / sequence_SO=supercontig / SO=protein_coding / is_pseudo=false
MGDLGENSSPDYEALVQANLKKYEAVPPMKINSPIEALRLDLTFVVQNSCPELLQGVQVQFIDSAPDSALPVGAMPSSQEPNVPSRVREGLMPFAYGSSSQQLVVVCDVAVLKGRDLGSVEAVGALLLPLRGTVLSEAQKFSSQAGGRNTDFLACADSLISKAILSEGYQYRSQRAALQAAFNACGVRPKAGGALAGRSDSDTNGPSAGTPGADAPVSSGPVKDDVAGKPVEKGGPNVPKHLAQEAQSCMNGLRGRWTLANRITHSGEDRAPVMIEDTSSSIPPCDLVRHVIRGDSGISIPIFVDAVAKRESVDRRFASLRRFNDLPKAPTLSSRTMVHFKVAFRY